MNWLRHGITLSLLLVGLLAVGCSNDVTVGAIISETGPLAEYGAHARNGITLALEEVQADPELEGKDITVEFRDDGNDPEKGVAALRELMKEHGVQAVIGAMGSRVTLALAPICQEENIILFSPAASAPTITSIGSNIWRNWPSDVIEATTLARFTREDLGLERLVVFTMNDPWGQGLSERFIEQYKGTSEYRNVVGTFDFDSGTSDGFDAMVEETKSLEPDGIYIVAYPVELAELARRLEAAEIGAVMMSTSAISPQVADDLGSAGQHLIFPAPAFDVASDDPVVSEFVSKYRAKFGENPDVYAAHAYDALKVLMEAMKTGGAYAPGDLRIGLQDVEKYPGAAGLTSFDRGGDVSRYPSIMIVNDGTIQMYEKFTESGATIGN